MIDSLVLLASKNPFATITSPCELFFRHRRFILLIQTNKNLFLSTMATAQAAENHGDDLMA